MFWMFPKYGAVAMDFGERGEQSEKIGLIRFLAAGVGDKKRKQEINKISYFGYASND